MKKLFTLFTLFFVFVLTALAGADFAPELDPAVEGEIVVAGSYSNFEALEAVFDGFAKFYPNVEMRYSRLDDYNNTIDVVLRGEEAPDIYCLQQWMIEREKYAFLFETAEDLANPDLNFDLDVIRPGLIYTMPDGKVPMLPIFTTAYGVLVNDDLFSENGLTMPVTYQELIDVAEKLKAADYSSPIMGYNDAQYLYHILTYTDFADRLINDPEAVAKLNALDPEAGEYMRPTLEYVKDVIDRGMIDTAKCSEEISDNYQSVILRFFEGDVPMMLVTGDTVSGTPKRESLSENFMNHPFSYSFHVLPSTDDGLYFMNPLSIAFAVNQNSADLELTNEFMRYLISTETLNQMAQVKRLITPTKDFSLDKVFASLGAIDEAHTINLDSAFLMDDPLIQMRQAAYAVGSGLMTIDEAVAAFGTFTN